MAANLDERIRQAPTTECCWSLAAVPIDQMVEPVTEGDHLGLVTDLAAVLRRSVAREAVPFTRSSDSGARGCKDAEMAEFAGLKIPVSAVRLLTASMPSGVEHYP